VCEFMIVTDATSERRESRIRLLSWGAVVFLVASTVLLFFLHSLRLKADPTLRWLVAFTIFGAVIGAYIVAFRQGMQRFKREMVFLLSDKEIVRKRRGWPDVKIAFSEIADLREEPSWLIVESIEPRKRIIVPKEVKGFESLRAELAKQHPLFAQAKLPVKGTALKGTVFATISVLSWVAVLWLRDKRLVLIAGAVGLGFLVSESYRLWVLLRRGPRRLFLRLCLGLVCLAALVLIYVRVAGLKLKVCVDQDFMLLGPQTRRGGSGRLMHLRPIAVGLLLPVFLISLRSFVRPVRRYYGTVRLLQHVRVRRLVYARTIASGSPRSLAIRSSTRRTRNPPNEVSTSMAGHSRVQSSTRVNMRITFPVLTQSLTKSIDQRSPAVSLGGRGCIRVQTQSHLLHGRDRPLR
jgi:hypothetical protein